ncbi:MAG: hypothetical protein HW403_1243 [Dehalococcoidia bacterium]|nr:hypothetical protein [Dehalococcoidia bacterium]
MTRGSDRILLFMLLGVGAAIVAGFVALVIVGRREVADFPANTPEGVVQRYLNALEHGDVEDAYGYLSRSIKDSDLEKNYKRDGRHPGDESSRQVVLEKSEITGDEARVIVSISTFRSSGPMETSENTYQLHFKLKLEDGQWRIVTPSYPPYLGWLPVPPKPRAFSV